MRALDGGRRGWRGHVSYRMRAVWRGVPQLGIGLLAMAEPSLRDVAEEMIERALREGTLAMKCRAREAK